MSHSRFPHQTSRQSGDDAAQSCRTVTWELLVRIPQGSGICNPVTPHVPASMCGKQTQWDPFVWACVLMATVIWSWLLDHRTALTRHNFHSKVRLAATAQTCQFCLSAGGQKHPETVLTQHKTQCFFLPILPRLNNVNTLEEKSCQTSFKKYHI